MNDTYSAENMYDAWDNGDRHEIRQQFARREELTRMARESGLWYKVGFPKEIERFAALVAAQEREVCAKVCESIAREQEPVAWGMRDMNGNIYDCVSAQEHARAEGSYNVPLYTKEKNA